MSELQTRFDTARENGTTLFMPYLCAGDPDLEVTRAILTSLDEWGADAVELGIPFSDPLADGPTLQRASSRSLEAGFRVQSYFDMLGSLQPGLTLPVVVMTYYNPVFRWGEERFLDRAAEAGADAVLVVDLPPEEGPEFYRKAAQRGLHPVFLATPTTPLERITWLSQRGEGFLYYVNVTGVTGVREGFDDTLRDRLEEVQEASELPVSMGFGVSDTGELGSIREVVNGVIVGSALAEVIEQNQEDKSALLDRLEARVRDLAEPLHESLRPAP